MSKKNFFKIWLPLLVFILALPLVACRQHQVQNLVDLPVAGSRNSAVASSQVRKVILDACKKRGWVAREISPGRISASIETRKHMAQIEIPYSGTRYSIIYQNSRNLKYDASKNTIHNQYNNWIDYLRKDIEVGLAQI